MKDNNQTSEDNRDSGVLSSPLSFIRSGYFNWDIATLRYHGNVGYYWLLRSGNAISSYGLGLSNMSLSPQGIGYRGDGFAVRCVNNTQWSGGLAPDSICPKGWQLPTYEGDKSFRTLFNTSYFMKNAYWTGTNQDSGIMSAPMSFIRIGGFVWNDASPNGRGGYGNLWSLSSFSTTSSYGIGFSSTALVPQLGDNHGTGFAVRCVVSLPILYVQKAGNYLLTQATNPSPLSLILAIL